MAGRYTVTCGGRSSVREFDSGYDRSSEAACRAAVGMGTPYQIPGAGTFQRGQRVPCDRSHVAKDDDDFTAGRGGRADRGDTLFGNRSTSRRPSRTSRGLNLRGACRPAPSTASHPARPDEQIDVRRQRRGVHAGATRARHRRGERRAQRCDRTAAAHRSEGEGGRADRVRQGRRPARARAGRRADARPLPPRPAQRPPAGHRPWECINAQQLDWIARASRDDDSIRVQAAVNAVKTRLASKHTIEWRHEREKRLNDAAAARGEDPVGASSTATC